MDYIFFVNTLLIKNKAVQRTVLGKPKPISWPTKMSLPSNSQFLCVQLETKLILVAVREP